MRLTYIKYFLFILLAGHLSLPAMAQGGLCPDNLDFEHGDFRNWVCRTGTVAEVGGVNTVSLPTIGQVPGRHTIISAATAGQDTYGGFPELCPNGSGYSVRLGNNSGGHEAESISYTFTIPATATLYSILYEYAVVLQNPSHLPEEQPRFRARIVDLSTNLTLPCVTFDFTASSSLPGFRQSFVDPTVYYKDWTPISLNLSGYAGKTILLEFITSDCTFNAHFGYAYMDVSTACNGAISGTTICAGDNSVSLTAPFGFQTYQWYSDNTFSTQLASTQVLSLTPPPTVGTVFPVIVGPYPGYGCTDTLYGTIAIANKPLSDAGADVSICKHDLAQIGGANTLGYTYAWTPASQVSNPIISNPLAWTTTSTPQEFIVKTTDVLTGCYSYDTTVVATGLVDTAIAVNGKSDFCIGQPSASLSVTNTATAIQWYDVNGPIPGAISFTFMPPTLGNYWAQIVQNGCTDSTRTISIAVHPLPQASFSSNSDTGCITNNSFTFTNTSGISDNSAMTYLWKFSDGSLQVTPDATITFSGLGTQQAELVATTSFGCKDSIDHNVIILPNGTPAFSWDSICVNRSVLFKNLSNEGGSAQVNYSWDFQDGGTGSLLKDPLPVTYTSADTVSVTLKLTALGCETAPQSVSRTVQVNAAVPGIRYHDITVPIGTSKFISVRDHVGNTYHWQPEMELNSYFTRNTEFFATSDDVQYLIDITDAHTCITTDTLQMLVLKKPGYYLPTAFTPNGDGLNDVAIPYIIGMKSLKSFSVYNRWGNLVFYSKKYGEGWDGKFKGIDQDAGVYVWILVYITNDDKTVTQKGTISIIR